MFNNLQTGSFSPDKLFIVEVVSFETDIGHYWYEITDFNHNQVINPATNLPLSDWNLESLIETIKKICPDCNLFFNFFMDV